MKKAKSTRKMLRKVKKSGFAGDRTLEFNLTLIGLIEPTPEGSFGFGPYRLTEYGRGLLKS